MKKKLDYYLKLNYPIEVTRIPNEEGGGYSACIPTFGRYALLADGETVEEAVEKILKMKDDHIKDLYRRNIGIPEPIDHEDLTEVSGKFLVRLPKELHRILVKRAEENNISLNQYVIYLLTKSVNYDLMESKLNDLIRKLESFDINTSNTEYKLNFDVENTKELVSRVTKANRKNLLYLNAG